MICDGKKQGKTGGHFKIADMYDEKRTNTGQDDSQIARVNNVDDASAGSCGRRERVVIDVATRIDAIDVTEPKRTERQRGGGSGCGENAQRWTTEAENNSMGRADG